MNEERIKLTDDNSENDIRYIKLSTGVFAVKGIIERVKDCSSYPGKPEVTYGKNDDKKGDLVLILTVDFGDYTRDVYLTGKFKRDKTGKVTAWDKWQNGVLRLLARILQDDAEIAKDLSIPEDVLAKLVNKEIMILRYQTGKEYIDPKSGETRYSVNDWFNHIYHPTIDDKDSMLLEWNASLEKGYPKDYDSNIAMLLESQNSRPTSNESNETSPENNKGSLADSDDLPF